MARLIIRKLDESLKNRLRVRAARHGLSMEEEARAILKASLAPEPGRQPNLAESIRRLIGPLGGVELMLPSRAPVRRPPKLAQ